MESYELTLVENAEVGSIVDAGDNPIWVAGSVTYDLDATETNDNDYFTIDKNTGQIRVGEIDFRLGRAGTIYPDEDTSLSMGATGYPYGDNAPAMEDPVLDFEGTNVLPAGGYSHGRCRRQAKGKGRCYYQAHGPEREGPTSTSYPGTEWPIQ